MSTKSAILVTAAAALLGACEGNYVYRPEAQPTARWSGGQAAQYQIPPEEPAGELQIASFGVSRVKPQAGEVGDAQRALHVRMVATNDGAAPWTIDTRKQQIDIRGVGQTGPLWARVHGSVAPLVTVPARDRRIIDLYFPLPEDMQHASRIPQFDLLWRVDVAGRMVAERTPFERLRVERVYAVAGPYEYGWATTWGPDFYYDPGVTLRFPNHHTFIPQAPPVYISTPAWQRP
jgi:hypothetical protein